MQSGKGIRLRFALMMLVIVCVILTVAVAGYASIQANRSSLASSYLQSNSQYAKKLASNTNEMLARMLAYMVELAKSAADPSFSQQDIDSLHSRYEEYFNSLVYVNSGLTIQLTSPRNLPIYATKLTSEASVAANNFRTPLISEPYVATTGRLIVLVSSPIFREDGTYAGFVGGTIYLQEENALSRFLSEHFYGNGSYMYVVDQSGRLIFHPDKNRINEAVQHNPVIDKALIGQSGSQQVANSKGMSFFAGYAFVPKSGWAVVSQTPVSVIDRPQKDLVNQMLLEALPLLAWILLTVWIVANRISKPLYQLAKFSEKAALGDSASPAIPPVIKSRIYEVNQLNQRLLSHLNVLNNEIQRDGLTGLANRKAFNSTINEWMEKKLPFSLVLLDVDHFKRVNDTYGHTVGDEVLKFVSSLMLSFSREEDLCFRLGGEEFGILVKKASGSDAASVAERLRVKLADSVSPCGEPVTVSIGISAYKGEDGKPGGIVDNADAALYRSKAEGRNRVTVS